jgi:hypothetical protein
MESHLSNGGHIQPNRNEHKSFNRSRGVAKLMLRAGAGFDYRDVHRKSVTPPAWLRIWAAQYPGEKYDLEHDRLLALTQKEPADVERIVSRLSPRVTTAIRSHRRSSPPSRSLYINPVFA